MWYFSWILGVGLAVAVGILNGIWHEFHMTDDPGAEDPHPGDYAHASPIHPVSIKNSQRKLTAFAAIFFGCS